MQGEEAATQSFHYILISSLIHGSDFPKGQLRFCSAQNGTWGFGSVVKLQPGFAHFGAICLWSQAASTCFFRGENMQEVLALARSSMQKGFRTPGSLLVQLQARWLQATGRMTQVSRAGQTSWYSHPSRVMTVISSSVVIVPPPSEGGLARPGARARRDWQECGYLGLCLVARDAS